MIVKTYAELAFFLNMFKNGNTELLIVESRGGLGKSRFVEEVLSESPYLRILSHVTPMQMFILGYKYRDLPIVVDDVDAELDRGAVERLLRLVEGGRQLFLSSAHEQFVTPIIGTASRFHVVAGTCTQAGDDQENP